MKIRWLWVGLSLSLALNVAFVGGFVYARFLAPPPVPSFPGAPAVAGQRPLAQVPVVFVELARELELDDAQRRNLRRTFQEVRRALEPRLREQAALRDKLIEELRKPQSDQSSIGQILDQMALARASVQKDTLRLTAQFAATLPADKQERFRQYLVARTIQQTGTPAQRPRRDGPAAPQNRDERAPRQ